LLDKLRYYDKGVLEGVNEMNTDVTKPQKMLRDRLKPIQHPAHLDSEDTHIIKHSVPAKNLTPYEHVPIDALAKLDLLCKESPLKSKFLQACILGAPNAGKSSLLNTMVGKNISAVSNKVNTTDEASKGIFTDVARKTQLALVDTPGVTKASNTMRSKLLVTRAWD
jgi:ribosome biogenesis GTPase A